MRGRRRGGLGEGCGVSCDYSTSVIGTVNGMILHV
jgi:hypothetical protein